MSETTSPQEETVDDGWVTEEEDGSFTPIDIPKGWVPSGEE